MSASDKPAVAGYGHGAMSLLLAIAILNYLDRNIINILVEPIKRDLQLTDSHLGLLSGLAFGLLYTVFGLPIARLAERGNRPLIIGAAVAVWSGFTMLCGLAQNFWQLALARVGVGVGEAGCTPPAHSLIMDYAPAEKRSSALAFYGLGPPLGGLLGMAFGGLVADAHGWRTAFLLAGAPGLLLAVTAVVVLPEPRRIAARRAAQAKAASAGVGETLRVLGSKRSFGLMVAAMTLKACISIGYGPFVASFYLRNHEADLVEAAGSVGAALGLDLGPIGLLGITLGVLAGAAGALGTWAGGYFSDRHCPPDPRRYLYGPAIAAVLCVPNFIAAVAVPGLGLSLALIGLHAFLTSIWYGPAFAAAFSIMPPHMRATGSAIILFTSSLIGLGLGPLAVGVLSDAFGASLGPAEGLRWALATFSLTGLVTALLFHLAAGRLRDDLVS